MLFDAAGGGILGLNDQVGRLHRTSGDWETGDWGPAAGPLVPHLSEGRTADEEVEPWPLVPKSHADLGRHPSKSKQKT